MLPSRERLRRKSVFQRAYKERRHVSSPQVSLYVLPKLSHPGNNEKWRPLVGFVVSKKTARNASARNRVKRQTREAYRKLSRALFDGAKEHISLSSFYALVFVVHPKAINSTFDEIFQAVESCLIRAEKKFCWQRRAGKQKSKDDQDVNRSSKSSSPGDNKSQVSSQTQV